MPDFIPKDALTFIKNKKLTPAFSYKDVWHEEHASCFTVAKAMQLDVLSDLHNAVVSAVENGESFDWKAGYIPRQYNKFLLQRRTQKLDFRVPYTFKKNIKPLLQQKGWWGKKKMTDPLTGQEVNARLGSDRRLKTIYRVNMRSAYQKGQYDRAMASELHPYLMYRIGPSVNHRADHSSWDGLVLPKNDPWWDSHFPPNGWGCKCYTCAVSESRMQKYKEQGIRVPPSADGAGGGTLRIKTEAPPVKYKTWFNERRGTMEQVPEGVDPAFNWNVGRMSRSVSSYENLVQKTRDKAPEQFDLVMSSIMRNEVNKTSFYGFVEDALERKRERQYTAPVGFLDTKTTGFLTKRGINLGNNNIVILDSNLVNGRKYTGKHTRMGNVPSKEDWYNLIDWLMDASVFWDGKGLIYLAKLSGSRYMKIAVDVNLDTGNHRGVRLFLPKLDTMYILDLSTESDRGLDEFNRIMQMEKIR